MRTCLTGRALDWTRLDRPWSLFFSSYSSLACKLWVGGKMPRRIKPLRSTSSRHTDGTPFVSTSSSTMVVAVLYLMSSNLLRIANALQPSENWVRSPITGVRGPGSGLALAFSLLIQISSQHWPASATKALSTIKPPTHQPPWLPASPSLLIRRTEDGRWWQK